MIGTLRVTKTLIFCILLTLFSSFVFADGGSFYLDELESSPETSYVSTCGSITGTTLVSNILPYYVGVNESKYLSLFAVDVNGSKINNNNNVLQVSFDNLSWFNMTYDASAESWDVVLTSDVEEDVTIYLHFASSTYSCINDSVDVKFRIPFYATVNVYKFDNATENVEPYENNFNYVYMKLLDTNEKDYSDYVPSESSTDRFFSQAYSWMPGIELLYPSSVDRTIVHWGHYDNGNALIKLYEEGTYKIFLLTHAEKGLAWNYEFYKPQQFDIKVESGLATVNLSTKVDVNLDLLTNDWEIDKIGYMFNWIKLLCYVVLILFGVGLIALLPGGTKVIGAIAPIILGLMFKLMGFI